MTCNSSAVETPSHCIDCVARARVSAGGQDSRQLQVLTRYARHSKYAAGQELFGQDTPVTAYANVVSGVIKLLKILEGGRQQVVGLKFATDFIGRVHGSGNPLAAEAVSDVEPVKCLDLFWTP